MDRLTRFRQRFWAKVDTTPGHGPRGDCWVWTASLNRPGGYGQIAVCKDGRSIPLKAHVVSYEMHKGPTNGLFVLHRCDNPPCINPAHLFLGTAKDNSQDAKSKGRPLGGPRVLTDATLHEVKTAPGKLYEIALRFGISKGTVSLIKNDNYPYVAKSHKRGRPPKLTKTVVEEIKAAHGKYADIGERYGVSGVHVGRIKRGLVSVYAGAA